MILLLPITCVAKVSGKDFTIVIDAGHGGKDFGACDNGAKEKEINLGVALQLEALMKKKMKEVNVIMTRNNDKYLTLQERADIANKEKGDLFISIHTNSVDKSNKNRKTVSGSSVYVLGLHKDDNNMKVAQRENSVIELESNYEQKYSGFDPLKDESYIIFEMSQKKNLSKSIKFAEDVQKELVGSGRGNRGVHQAGFWVLWATSMPAVLVELDFICNPGAAQYMTSEKGQRELANSIFKAVEKYYDSWMNSNVSNPVKQKDKKNDKATAADIIDSHKNEKDVENPVLVGSAQTVNKKKVDTHKGSKNKKNNSTLKRRRRSETSKSASDSKSFETADIRLHSENERNGQLLATSDSDVKIKQTVDESNDKGGKKKGKKEKKKKEKIKKENKKRDKNSHNAKIEKFVTVYKIQILASAELLKQNNPRFCGLAPISTYKENNLYKYFYGESTEQAEIEEMLKEVKKKIPDAFIVSSKKSLGSAKN